MVDKVSPGLKKLGGGLKTIGTGFKNLAKIGVASFALIAAGVVALGKAFAEQETANSRLASAFDAVGESGSDAVKQWGAWATSIQRTTTLGDEEIMNLVTLGKVMGVTNDKLEEATKGAIGLAKAFGIDMTASMKMVALAQQGEFEMLARYIPALRAATTEAEKQDIVNRAMANGFKMAEAELDTLGGQWTALKGVIGDAMQEAGKAVGEGGFTDMIKGLKEAIIELTENGAITSWAQNIAQTFRSLGAEIKQAKKTIDLISQSNQARAQAKSEIIGERGEGVSGALKFRLAEGKNKELINARAEEILQSKIAAKRKKETADKEWDMTIRRQREYDQQVFGAPRAVVTTVAPTPSGVKSVAEKIEEVTAPSAVEGTKQKQKAVLTESTTELFQMLSKGRSFAGATSALTQVATAAEGESTKALVKLAEERNEILKARLGGVSEG